MSFTFKSINDLDNISLKPFQKITLLSGYNNNNLKIFNEIYKNEYLTFFLKNNKPIIIDIEYHLENVNLYLNWDFVKERCKQLKCSYLNEIFSDTLMNISLSHGLLNVKHSFNYKENLIETIKYYHRQLKENIILRIDSYYGNNFFIYKG